MTLMIKAEIRKIVFNKYQRFFIKTNCNNFIETTCYTVIGLAAILSPYLHDVPGTVLLR